MFDFTSYSVEDIFKEDKLNFKALKVDYRHLPRTTSWVKRTFYKHYVVCHAIPEHEVPQKIRDKHKE